MQQKDFQMPGTERKYMVTENVLRVIKNFDTRFSPQVGAGFNKLPVFFTVHLYRAMALPGFLPA